jgi:hypothetical protein
MKRMDSRRLSMVAICFATVCSALNAAAQDPPAAEKTAAKVEAKKEDDGKKALGQRAPGDVKANEEISFRQEKVAAEMSELESRMFRLADTLKSLEPENSSRLLIGLKYAREELILHQMKEIKDVLDKVSYAAATGSEKEVLAKLRRLEQLLVSGDFDLQLQLQRLRALREIMRRLDGAIKEEDRELKQTKEAEAKKDVPQEKFEGMKNEQAENRKTTEDITDQARELGDVAAVSVGELVRAGGSMSGAEGRLGAGEAGPAGQLQMEALASLKLAKERLSEVEQRLLDEVRASVKKRIMEGLAEMLEKQIIVRQSTERLGPRLKDGSRQVLASVVGLAAAEEQIMKVGEELIALAEETEFGIALPAALQSVLYQMDEVKAKLAAGDASSDVVEAEKQIEEDLKALQEAMKQLPSQGQPRKGSPPPGDPEDQERELNRIIAELKMIRMLQMRVNGETKRTDGQRGERPSAITNEMRRKIQALHDRQLDIHDVTEKLNETRGNEVSGQ